MIRMGKFICQLWVNDIYSSISQTEDEVQQGPWAEYQIYVRTGDRVGATTKADVKVTLYGEKGRTKEFTLKDSVRNKIKFQRGKVCEYNYFYINLKIYPPLNDKNNKNVHRLRFLMVA